MLTHGVFFHDSQYGQVQAINQLISAYFQVTFTEWCWVFMDGVWTISLAFTLPLARPAARLSPSRPTASILGLHTMSSFLGILLINFIFTVISMFVLFAQDWYQCRKWDDNDVSNVSWWPLIRCAASLECSFSPFLSSTTRLPLLATITSPRSSCKFLNCQSQCKATSSIDF